MRGSTRARATCHARKMNARTVCNAIYQPLSPVSEPCRECQPYLYKRRDRVHLGCCELTSTCSRGLISISYPKLPSECTPTKMPLTCVHSLGLHRAEPVLLIMEVPTNVINYGSPLPKRELFRISVQQHCHPPALTRPAPSTYTGPSLLSSPSCDNSSLRAAGPTADHD